MREEKGTSRGEAGGHRLRTKTDQRTRRVPSGTMVREPEQGENLMGDEHRPNTWGGSGKRSVQAVPTSAGARGGQPARAEEGPDATDAAKALAAQHNVDLASVEGSGAEGRITKDDVAEHVEPDSENDAGGTAPGQPEAG
jgi:pyruvate/2-oxoglutarate dehydrogenase complex dihydrolipoamide acyltransferase (E2) component